MADHMGHALLGLLPALMIGVVLLGLWFFLVRRSRSSRSKAGQEPDTASEARAASR